MASIADLFGRLLLDDSGFEADVVKTMTKAGQSGGRSMGEQISGSLKGMAVRGIGLAIAGGLAVAAKGVAELENVVADFRAETGATEEEAKKAGQAILEMSSRNIQPLGEIGKVLTKVHTDMGLTGDAAAKTAEAFLKFGRATKQDAAAAVSAFDNILDAWNLTAEDSQSLMDKLVVSNQKFGGVISENEAALAAMAPAMQAANMSIDDGIALLNLFNTAGIDAAKAPAVLAQAIKQLKPGQDLNDLIAQIGAIEDPTLRAQEAMKVFGARAGIGMAQAIKPGMTSLDELTASLGDTTGATTKAADVLDSTFTSWLALKIKAVGAAIIDLGTGVGPAVTALAGLGTVIGTLGGDKLLSAFGPKLLEAFKTLGKEAGSALGDGVEAVMTGAQGTVLGNFIASRIEVILGPKNSRLGDAARAAGAKLGAIFGPAFALGSKVAEGITSLLVKLPGMSIVRSAILTSGMALGGAFGTAVTIGTAAGIVGIAAVIAEAVDKELDKLDISKLIFGEKGFTALEDVGKWTKSLPWPWGPVGEPNWFGLRDDTKAGIETGVVEPTTQALTGALTKGGDLGDRLAARIAAGLKAGVPEVKTAVGGIGGAFKILGDAVEIARRKFDRLSEAIHVFFATDELAGEAAASQQHLIELHSAQLLLDKAYKDGKISKKEYTRQTAILNGDLATERERMLNIQIEQAKLGNKPAIDTLAAWVTAKIKLFDKLTEAEKRALLALIQYADRSGGKTHGRAPERKAAGGPVQANTPYLVNEDTPRSELFVPDVNGRIVTQAQAAAAAATSGPATAMTAGPVTNNFITNVAGLLRARTAHDIGDVLHRLADFGVLTPRPVWNE